MNKYRELRKLTGLSTQKFGDKYGIPMRTVQGWELEKATPPEYVYKLLERVVKEDMTAYDTPVEAPRQDSPHLDQKDIDRMKELCDELIKLVRDYKMY